MSDARETIAGCLDFGGQCETCFCSDETRCEVGAADKILSALSAMPLASRLALTRALVPGWAVVPVEPTVAMLQDGDMAIRHARPGGVSGMTIEAQTKAECARAGACWAAMLTAAEEPPHEP